MKHIQEFSRFAHEYERYKIIQSKVAHHLVQKSRKQGRYILDLGAGSGEVYRQISWPIEKFYAVDFSQKMLSLHPDDEKIEKILCNFDTKSCMELLHTKKVDQIFAASSLHWSKDLDLLFARLKKLSPQGSFALFTDRTFQHIWDLTDISSPLPSFEKIVDTAKRYFMVNYERREYRLFFEKKEDIFTYIKRSGVSAGKKRLPFSTMKRVIREYPYRYLTFEVVFLWCESG